MIKSNGAIPTCLLWGGYLSFEVKTRIGMVRYFDENGMLSILGITSNDGIYQEIFGYKYISKESIDVSRTDFVVVLETGSEFDRIRCEILSRGFRDEVIIPFNVMVLDGFDIRKYRRLKEDTPTIFSINCWGGITYHSLGLQFKSPTINMFFDAEDYIKFLKDPRHYLGQPLTLHGTDYNRESDINYPVAKCGDILLFFNHYVSLDNAEECWKRRIKRINWDNIFVMMWTEDKNIASEFINLPYGKKVCFVSFPTDEESLLYIDYLPKLPDLKLWQINLGLARGDFLYYDVFHLLNDGKITRTTAAGRKNFAVKG